MNEPHDLGDPLESELAALHPPQPSPALKRRIAERLRQPQLTWRRVAILVGGSLAAGIAVLLAWPQPEPVVNNPLMNGGPVEVTGHRAAPTLADYRRAVGQSPVALEELLNRHTSLSVRSPGNAGALRAGQRFDPALLETMGGP